MANLRFRTVWRLHGTGVVGTLGGVIAGESERPPLGGTLGGRLSRRGSRSGFLFTRRRKLLQQDGW